MKQSLIQNETVVLILLILSVVRIYLEVVGFDFAKLPLTKTMIKNPKNFHRYGFYFSVGYFLLFAPNYLFM